MASNSSRYASVNMLMVNAKFRPLGLGRTQTTDPPNVAGCNPQPISRWFKNTEAAGLPRNAMYLGLYFATLRSKGVRAAMKSARLRSAAPAVGRATAEVIPNPSFSNEWADSG